MTINKGYTVINKPLSSEYYQTTSHVMKTRDHIFRLGINTILGWPFCPPKISFDYILLTLGTGLSLKSTQRMIFSQFSDLWKWHWNEGFFIIKGIFDRNIFPGIEFSGELFPGIFSGEWILRNRSSIRVIWIWNRVKYYRLYAWLL